MKLTKILPQANSLETVIRVFIFISVMKEYSIVDIANFCNFDPRQASYYLNACYYLDLVDDTGNLSSFGRSIVDSKQAPQKAIYERIITDEIIGKIFAHMLISYDDDIKLFAHRLLSTHYPQYGDAVIKRRASTLRAWCEEIIRNLQLNKAH